MIEFLMDEDQTDYFKMTLLGILIMQINFDCRSSKQNFLYKTTIPW